MIEWFKFLFKALRICKVEDYIYDLLSKCIVLCCIYILLNNFKILRVTQVYNKGMLQGIISKLYKIQGTTIINAITIGNKTVQQYDISWS